jgi:hypothetical protein
VTIVVPTYGFASQRCQAEDICVMAEHTVKKGIHTPNEERQVFIKRKSEDYKSFLNRYPKSSKHSQPGNARLPRPSASAA